MSQPRTFSERFGIFWGWVSPAVDRRIAPLKKQVLDGLGGAVIEIGAGVGSNFKYYDLSKIQHVTAIEPNTAMHKLLEEEAAKYGFSEGKGNLTILKQAIEHVSIPSESADFVVSTLVLCSVTSLNQSVKRVASWLKPGGNIVFVEHVAHKHGTLGRSLQKSIQKPWAWIGDGCDLVRDTHEVLASEGKLDVKLFGDMRDSYSLAPPVYGIAIKAKL
ncbi:hypothetical protein SeMB42_g05708 [Synchytrium endobioticum]|uniref:Methyltransferase type 11 domain-containing protein n=1 Tax=Synchytrium endobioticum TaxID=286115 RepID=A0A507CPT2_9FUNG|nr:hypothetical protein SeMB42_g05708 [Synchytrium endobioticum]TPX45245.1 hypothetical protein SeLEV6574_g03988 [Synchytrium endobioticum]